MAASKNASHRQRQKPTDAKGKSVRMMGNPKSSPPWLASLRHLQNRCTSVTGVLVTALLIAYGWSAYSQNSWQKAYSQLEALKKQERQLMRTNEVLKNDLASQAQHSEMGLVSPSPAEAIALEPSNQTGKTPNAIATITQPHHFTSLPIGY